MFDRPRRTRYCEVWDEKLGEPVDAGEGEGATRLALQLINVYDSPDHREIRACYYRDGRQQVRPPHFAAQHWLPLLLAVIADPGWTDDAAIRRVLVAACERLGITPPALAEGAGGV